ncbi:MAG: HAD-IA family hydrolase [Eubacteriales bacterium]|nr:HAD-IA family hydrolase [Eubacteriales bacterium]
MPAKAGPRVPMYRYNVVLFDLDGTLLNTLEDLTDAVNHTLRRFGHPPRTQDEVRLSVGNGVRRLIEGVLPLGAADPDMENALAVFKRYYTEHCDVRTHPYEGVLEALAALGEAGVRLGIVSNKNEDAVQALSQAYFGSLVSVVVGGKDGVPRKPAPDMPLLALQALGGVPERALYVGDSDVDVQTAKGAGMDCMLVTWGFRTPEELAGLTVMYRAQDAAEIPALVLQSTDEES